MTEKEIISEIIRYLSDTSYIVILQKVSDGLNTNEFSDLIVKKSLQWLKGDIEKICAYYQ